MEELDTESALEELSKTSTALPAALLLKIEGILPDLSRHCSITQLQPVNDTFLPVLERRSRPTGLATC